MSFVTMEDLIVAGSLGLLECVDNYEPARSDRFISYASYYIKLHIRQELYLYVSNVRIPLQKRSILNRFKKVLERNEGDFERTISDVEFLPYREDIQYLLNITNGESSFDAPVNTTVDDKVVTLTDIVPANEERNNDYDISSIINKDLRKILNTEDIYIIKNYYGYQEEVSKTLKEIGNELGMSSQTVLNKKNDALKKLFKDENMRKSLYPYLT